MAKGKRFLAFLITFLPLLMVFYYYTGEVIPTEIAPLIIFTSLLMVAFTSFFIEHFFTKPTDVLASTLSITMLIYPVREYLLNWGVWYDIFLVYNTLCLAAALFSILLFDQESSTNDLKNRVALWLKELATRFGNGRFLYFCIFSLSIVFYQNISQGWIIALVIYAAYSMLIQNFAEQIFSTFDSIKKRSEDIGEIFGVQSKNTFLVKLYKDRGAVCRFDFVELSYSLDKERTHRYGMIIDNYHLNEQQWIKVLSSPEIQKSFDGQPQNSMGTNIVRKANTNDNSAFLERFIGVVIEGSSINKIRFEYAFRNEVSEGDLLEVSIKDKKILYQVVQGTTAVETLEQKNETGLIVGEAMQLGLWNQEKGQFDKYGWVPEMNAPLHLAKAIPKHYLEDGELIAGYIPNSKFPAILNKADAISHHLAILGVTGSGKSVFARNLIREIAIDGTKIICVDFTNEYKGRFTDLGATPIVNNTAKEQMLSAIEVLCIQFDEFPNKRNRPLIKQNQKIIEDVLDQCLSSFLNDSNQKLAIFELPDISNTIASLEFTKWFFQRLFSIAKTHRNYGHKVCVVLEEAHTVIPEWNFLSNDEKGVKALVNCIGQIALQGRKYDIGLMLIAQRTASVSKTILTQCNTIIAFQQFDQTGADFLVSYMGKDMAQALPNLKPRQAIATGKAFKSNMPIIFQVPEIEENNELNEAFQDEGQEDRGSSSNTVEPRVRSLN